ncbi:MAG: hypothetical protein KAI79_18130, partial [Bacteroidales bacterium]|nr:hypothetical protein [Bacteroidales bacterium]
MRFKLFTLLMFIAVTAFAQNKKKINIKGFGELTATQKGDVYTIDIADYGPFDFKGSINPISLKADITISDLKKVPGYKVLNNLGLQDISFDMSSDGLKIKASADTEKNLKGICKLLKISTPTVEIEAKITKTSFELEGELAFSKEPIKILEIKETGAKLSYYSAGLGAAFEPGSAEISVSTTLFVKPSKFDPDLEVKYEFGYNLVTQEITGSGSMKTEWIDPFGMEQFLNTKNSIIIKNGAVEFGFNPQTLVPTNIGFAIERAKIFKLDFGVAMSFAPLKKQVVLWAKRDDKMTLNDITTMLNESFGVKVDFNFPKDYYLDSVEIKFAPTEGFIGDFKIDKGFKFAGAGRFKELTGYLDFDFDLENEFSFKMDFKGDYRKFIMNEAHKLPKSISKIIDQVLTEIQIQRIFIDLNAQKSNLSLNGEMICEFKFQGKLEKVSFEASLDAEQIAKNLVNKLVEKYGGPLFDLAKNAGKEASKIAKNAVAEARKLMKDAKTISKHTHSKDECDKKCVPRHAKNLSAPIVEGSFDAVRKFYFS